MREHQHHWSTASEHPTSEGRLAYRTCRCGRWRVVLAPAETLEVGSRVLAERRGPGGLRAVQDGPGEL